MTDLRITQLDSGLTVATERVPGTLSVATGVWVGVGSRDEPETIGGVSHFLEQVYEISDCVTVLRNGQLEPAATAFNEAISIASLFGLDQAVHLNRGFLGYTLARLGQVQDGAEKLVTALRDYHLARTRYLAATGAIAAPAMVSRAAVPMAPTASNNLLVGCRRRC